MNRRIIGLLSVVLLLLIGFVLTDKTLFAVPDKKNHKKEHKAQAVTKEQEELLQKNDAEGEDLGEEEIAVDEFDLQKKQKDVRSLIERGVEFCANNSMPMICHAFTHTKDFIEGELYLFLLDTKGVIYAHGDQEDLLWKNMWDYHDSFGALAVQSMVKTAKAGANWLTYEWAGAVKVTFVQQIKIDDKDYVIGCGYYPHSKKYAAIGLVKGAVGLFTQDVKEGYPIEDSFGAMGYSLSERFTYGDLYLYALDFNGEIRAQGDNPDLIGENVLERKDSRGKAINKEIINKLKEKAEGEGIWVEYFSKNALKYAYAEKVKDRKGNYYFIACGYYPEIDRDKTIELVRRGYQLMKSSGIAIAAQAFTDKSDDMYRLGDLDLFVYDMKGKCIANGANTAAVGKNQFDKQDQDGRYYVREMIEQAKTANGWLDFKLKNSFQATYVEKVEMGIDTYIIASGIFPVTKPETMTLLVKSALGYLQSHTADETFEKFVTRKGEFIRGDLFVFAVDLDGYCYAWGDDYPLIWKNILDWKDDEGKMFIKKMVEGSDQGPDHYIYKFNKKMRVDYAEQVEKDGKKYLIGSGFYK
ncbi:MAG TPA: cache domain-containing protein [Candidatus Babeliales bacterium]|jgi:signal transduction histidine kinase|nr:cache domain-containing protein [Candidatus Babeliales bacterium]